MNWLLLAAAEGEVLPASPNWIQVIIQGGSFVLLAIMLVYGIPWLRKTESADRERERKDHAKIVETLLEKHERAMADAKETIARVSQQAKDNLDAVMKDQKEERRLAAESQDKISATYKAESAAERAACERHFEALANAMRTGNEATIASIKASADQIHQHSIRNQQWQELLNKALAKEQAKLKEG